ncbi:DUF6069 family protein [Streptomyces sp. S07_1.15]|uniref:DUF6069 family protein n=1 Tax=Streptomyces sp. S07_1.15 TaxID=2873925 RepID=UPI001D157DE8|nr:DUF6069 family protein [Streptomyces sp. S07_1.15]MCC3654793.1 DUF6069 family protein [Streptomyces sp. S07_1.15]
MSSNTVQNPGPAVPDASAVHRSGLTWWKALATGAAFAVLVNLIVLAVAELADASLVVVDGGKEHPIAVGDVIGASVVPLAVGTGAALLLSLWKLVFLRIAQYTGGGLALLSVAGPLSSGADGGTVAALSLMHITLGVAVVITLELHRRHRLL